MVAKFRGWTIEANEEVKGSYCVIEGKHYIFTPYRLGKSCNCCDGCDCIKDSIETNTLYEVHRKTVGQFTGLEDKNGKEIYEGDMVMADSLYGWVTPRTVSEFGLNIRNMSDDTFEVIGNIHELLEK